MNTVKLARILLFFCVLFMLLGCTTETKTVVQTNRFVQTDYDYDCLTGDKTFSEIIICYQAQDGAEKAQNAITNDLISKGSQKQ